MNSSVVELSAELCPDIPTLVAYRSGQLAEPDAEQLAEHLEICGLCSSTLQNLDPGPPDPLEANLLRFCAGKKGINSTVQPPYHELEARALALGARDTLAKNAPNGDFTDIGIKFAGALGPYILQDVLGRGGMGVVFRAFHRTLRRPVALKTIYAGTESRPVALMRFRVEGEAIARLDHPNIVKVYDFGECEDQQYLAMELVEGETLLTKLSTGPLECADAVRLLYELAGALAYAHDQGVIHRDLKPANVLITRQGVPKVVDFGLARLIGDPLRLTANDAVMGTPNYMAPEQAEGRASHVNEQTDVYALGVILYEALTGGPLFVAESKSEVLRLVRAGNFVSPRQLCPVISLDLEAICLKCLERSQRDRYRSAHELRQDLEHLLNGKPVLAKRPTRLRLLGKSVRRYAPRALAAFLLTCVLAGGAVVLLPTHTMQAIPSGESAWVRKELERELDKGKPVTLVDETGWPRWFRWRCGKDRQRMHIEPDGTFSAEMIDRHALGLLELLPDARTNRYRLTGQIRHDVGGYGGSVGLYVAHHVYPWPQVEDIHFFNHVQFNAVTRTPVERLGPKDTNPIPETRPVTLVTRLFTERTVPPCIDVQLDEVVGGRMVPLGPRNGVWHDFELTVTTDGIAASIAGHDMVLQGNELLPDALNYKTSPARSKFPDDDTIQNLRPAFTPRGGIGLILYPNAAASIRRVTVSPLPPGR